MFGVSQKEMAQAVVEKLRTSTLAAMVADLNGSPKSVLTDWMLFTAYGELVRAGVPGRRGRGMNGDQHAAGTAEVVGEPEHTKGAYFQVDYIVATGGSGQTRVWAKDLPLWFSTHPGALIFKLTEI